MNRRLCVWVGSILALFSLAGVCPRTLFAQDLPPAAASSIPLAAMGASEETPYIAAITRFVQDQVALLAGDDFTQQTAARNKLKSVLARGSSPAYYSAFSKAWTAAASAEISKNASIGVRLNLAIITFNLADSGVTPDAQPMVLLLLKDREPCVVLWGIKAARPLISLLVEGEAAAPLQASPLPPAVVAAVKKCGDLKNDISDVSGFAAADAYTALTVSIPGKDKDPGMKVVRPLLVRPLLDILEYRIAQHAKGTVQLPGAERSISTWLSAVFPDLTSTDQKRLVQLLVNLETDVGIRTDLYQYRAKDLSQIRIMLQYVSSALKVISNGLVGSRLDWLTSIGPAASPEQIKDHTAQVFGTMQLVIHDLTQPAPIPVIAPPPPPTTNGNTRASGGTGALTWRPKEPCAKGFAAMIMTNDETSNNETMTNDQIRMTKQMPGMLCGAGC